MPMLTVRLCATPSDRLAADVAGDLLDLTATHLRKRADLTAIAVQFVAPSRWFIGGRALADDGLPAAFVEIRITEHSNTAVEKARYINAVHAALALRLGGLHETSYVQVQDLPASTWGWGGRTQAERAALRSG